MEVANFVLPAIHPPNSSNNNTEDVRRNSVNANSMNQRSLLKLPNTILGKVLVNKNTKFISNERKDALKNIIDTLIGNDNFSNRMRAMDVQRIISIVDEMEKKILILNMIPKQLDVVFKIDVGSKVYDIIRTYKDIEKELIARQEHCEKAKINVNEDKNYVELEHQYKSIIRRIYRLFLQDKDLYNRLYQSYTRRMNKLEEKEKEEDNLFSSDSRRLESEKAYKKFEFYIKKNKIFFEERLMESVEEEQLLKEKIEIMNDSLKAEIELLEQQYNEMLQKNTEEELFLRKKTYKVESEVENWIHKYDQEVGERQNELEDLMKRFDEGHKTLSIQKDRYEEVSEEFEKIMIRTEEEKKEKERLERIEFLTRNNNARRIQKVWRIFFTSRGSFKGTNKKSKKEKEKKKKSGKSKSGDKKKKK
ncbi:hypothetical protein H8356DRAFT_926048 [Neocallimastix lanati (nom. inval.)]|uniref:Dynein regulatory complex protein 10 n=1 Tax=Neocallimastix californiae TaxID=1754190 RepID=A0A1Y2ERM0_9FUNG|nr:hypothetical protein H8356DRAFT_926048 [Neocallimastix sp. JGI-2020a]ORY74198.1 hypothetical protein LY90DRAFT_502704 [Neocallimastix californiae]|eukprot:ORY74198.1 hypothetical protein LY90DRAFT_502704 [Neocallimastix californiae]